MRWISDWRRAKAGIGIANPVCREVIQRSLTNPVQLALKPRGTQRPWGMSTMIADWPYRNQLVSA